jgi:polyisoprenoid-binding protein YceI
MKKIMKQLLITFLLALAQIVLCQNQYALDKDHSRLGFTAKHLKINTTTGNFKNFDATLVSAKEDFTDAVITMQADAKSVNTDVEKRDKDLKSEGWLNIEKYKFVEFKSTSFKKISGKAYKLEGILTMRGVAKPIVFDVTYNGMATDPTTKKKSIGFTVTGKLNRRDFGIGYSNELIVGNNVNLICDVAFIISNGKGLVSETK